MRTIASSYSLENQRYIISTVFDNNNNLNKIEYIEPNGYAYIFDMKRRKQSIGNLDEMLDMDVLGDMLQEHAKHHRLILPRDIKSIK